MSKKRKKNRYKAAPTLTPEMIELAKKPLLSLTTAEWELLETMDDSTYSKWEHVHDNQSWYACTTCHSEYSDPKYLNPDGVCVMCLDAPVVDQTDVLDDGDDWYAEYEKQADGWWSKTFFKDSDKSPASSVIPKHPTHRMSEFKLEEGLVVYASAVRDVPVERNDNPDVGLYFAATWIDDAGARVFGDLDVPWINTRPPEYPMVYLPWTDYSAPNDTDEMIAAGEWVLELAAQGKRVEVGCLGAHGRTGTFLALLLVLQGIPPGSAIKRVRDMHCEKAIESERQVGFVRTAYKSYHKNEDWLKNEEEVKTYNDELDYSKPKGLSASKPAPKSTDWSWKPHLA